MENKSTQPYPQGTKKGKGYHVKPDKINPPPRTDVLRNILRPYRRSFEGGLKKIPPIRGIWGGALRVAYQTLSSFLWEGLNDGPWVEGDFTVVTIFGYRHVCARKKRKITPAVKNCLLFFLRYESHSNGCFLFKKIKM